MSRPLPLLALLSAVCLLGACESTPTPGDAFEGNTEHVYAHSKRYMIEEAAKLWRPRWEDGFEEVDLEEGRIVTNWRTKMHPQSDQGRRQRLIIEAKGEDGAVRLLVKHETEKNTEKVMTLRKEMAKWVPMNADGALALEFLTLLSFKQGFQREEIDPGAALAPTRTNAPEVEEDR